MIKRLTIQNFQKHKHIVLDFSTRVNVICGLSDTGKTATIRALKAILYRDKFFVRKNETDASIVLDFDDGTVERKCKFSEVKKCPECGEKADGKQICSCGEILSGTPTSDKYIVGTNEYEKFGKSLPDFITEKLRMFPIKFVDVEENIQMFNQHDDMFFIGQSYSGGKRNKIISSLFPDSDRVDFLIKKFNSDASFRKSKIEIFEQEKSDLKKKIEDGKTAYDMVRILSEEIEEMQDELVDLKEEMVKLSTIKAKINESEKVIKYEDKIKKIDVVLSKIKDKFNEANNNRKSFVKLSEIHERISKNYDFQIKTFDFKEVETLNKEMANFNRLSSLSSSIKSKHSFEIKQFGDTKKLFDEYFSVVRSKEKLKKIFLSISEKDTEINTEIEKGFNVESELLKKKEEFKNFLNESNTICPLIKQEFCEKCKGILSDV